jgi:hypothetical protein
VIVRSAPANPGPPAQAADGASQKEPAIGDGSQSREETLGKVIRFAAALCVVIHTRRGKLLGLPPLVSPGFADCDVPVDRRQRNHRRKTATHNRSGMDADLSMWLRSPANKTNRG